MNDRVRPKRAHHMDLMHFILVLVQAADRMMAVCFLIEAPCGQISVHPRLCKQGPSDVVPGKAL